MEASISQSGREHNHADTNVNHPHCPNSHNRNWYSMLIWSMNKYLVTGLCILIVGHWAILIQGMSRIIDFFISRIYNLIFLELSAKLHPIGILLLDVLFTKRMTIYSQSHIYMQHVWTSLFSFLPVGNSYPICIITDKLL